MQWLSGRVLDSRPRGWGFEPQQHHCIVSLSKNINPSLWLVQPRKTHPYITERLLVGRKESNQTNKSIKMYISASSTEPSLFTYQHFGFKRLYWPQKNNSLTLLHANNIGANNLAHAHKLIITFDVQSLESQYTSLWSQTDWPDHLPWR